MKKLLLFFIFLAWCGITPGTAISQETPDKGAGGTITDTPPETTAETVLKKLEARYHAADFSAEFFQESALKALDIADTAAGKVWFKHPGMMRWEYDTPENYAIISDGKNLWIYRPEDNQVLIGDAMTYFSNGKGASFLSNFSLVQDAYTVSLSKPPEADLYALKLVPKQKQLDLSAIFLNIDRESLDIRSVETLNDYGDETRIEFRNLTFGETDASLFNFKIPPGADVLELRE
jgi:outer membrane lipoprotein carrier protein